LFQVELPYRVSKLEERVLSIPSTVQIPLWMLIQMLHGKVQTYIVESHANKILNQKNWQFHGDNTLQRQGLRLFLILFTKKFVKSKSIRSLS
jgi:hypothetical protein